MSFKELVEIIEKEIKQRKQVSLNELMTKFSDIMSENGFCFCDLADVLHNLERAGKIEVKGNKIRALD